MEPQFETVELEGNSLINVKHFECESLKADHDSHYHPEFELTYIMRGEGTRFVGDSVEKFRAEDLVFIGPNLPHCWVSEEGKNSGLTKVELMVVQFRLDCFGDQFLALPDALLLKKFHQMARRGFKVSKYSAPKVIELILQLNESKGLERVVKLLQVLTEVIAESSQEYLASESYLSDSGEFHHGRMEAIIQYVHKNLADEIKQADVAELVGMTPQGFCRFFKATTGRTFVSFVNVLRIMKASRLLVNSRSEIIEVAHECGYSNLSNFNRRFKELKEITPSGYRKQYGQNYSCLDHYSRSSIAAM